MDIKESEEVEFKKTTLELKEGVISLTSMLNKKGHGVVYFGVKHDGTIYGEKIYKDSVYDITYEIKKNIWPIVIPCVDIVDIDDKKVIKVEVSGDDKPYSAYGRYYIRADDQDIGMDNNTLETFFINKNIDYSKWENEITEYGVESIDENLLIKYIEKGNEVGRISFLYEDEEDALTKLGLMKNHKLNNAGVFLFSNLKPWTLKLAVYPTDERLSFIDNVIFNGNIFECIDEAYKYIVKNIHWKGEIVGMQRVETPEVPVEAIREIVVNSFVHMKVNNSSFSEIYITPSKIRIYNPGLLAAGKDPKDFASGNIGSIARNPLINKVLYLNKTVESFGTGFKRVFSLCDKNNVQYRYFNNDFGFVFEFLRNPLESDRFVVNDSFNSSDNNFSSSFNWNDENKVRLSKVDELVFMYIKSNFGIKKIEIATCIKKTEMTVQRSIKKLIDNGFIERVGSNKTGYWRPVKKD